MGCACCEAFALGSGEPPAKQTRNSTKNTEQLVQDSVTGEVCKLQLWQPKWPRSHPLWRHLFRERYAAARCAHRFGYGIFHGLIPQLRGEAVQYSMSESLITPKRPHGDGLHRAVVQVSLCVSPGTDRALSVKDMTGT